MVAAFVPPALGLRLLRRRRRRALLATHHRLRQTDLVLRDGEQLPDCAARKRSLFASTFFSLCLSRACLGKITVFYVEKWTERPFFAPHEPRVEAHVVQVGAVVREAAVVLAAEKRRLRRLRIPGSAVWGLHRHRLTHSVHQLVRPAGRKRSRFVLD